MPDTTNMKLARFSSGSIKGFGGGLKSSANLVGTHFYSTSQRQWTNLNNWWAEATHTIQATTLPTALTNVTILDNSVIPFVELSATSWVQPLSINAGNVGIVFYSGTVRSVTCNITVTPPASARFTGSAFFNF